ncbi:hypothetical protein V1477_011219 [Vespula maculifrons]|uniref:Uncharacterized protein n=3 Tax=Vespula TaxID=7451 RepID=A0A836UU15_VESVU|nr:hypothetical protein HZH66_003945 [Vespula vulgaris]
MTATQHPMDYSGPRANDRVISYNTEPSGITGKTRVKLPMPSSCDHQHQPTSSTLVIRELHRTLDQVEKLAALIARDVHCNKFYEEEEEEEKEDFVVVVVVNVVERGQSLRRRKIFVKVCRRRFRKG